MPDRRHLSTHMMPTTIRWTQLARVTHKNWDDTHLHGNPLRTVSIRHRRNKEMRHNSSDAAPTKRTQKHIWPTNPHIKSNVLPLGKHLCTSVRNALVAAMKTPHVISAGMSQELNIYEPWMSVDRQHVPTETAMFKHGEGAHSTSGSVTQSTHCTPLASNHEVLLS